MQILLNQAEVSQIAVEYVQTMMGLDGINNDFRVECNDDGTITVVINEEAGDQPDRETQQTTGERPAKKPRRTKAQIEADNKAEAERLAAAQADAASGNDAVSTVKPDAETPVVEAEVVGETTQEQSAPGEPDEDASPVEPDPVVDTAVAVEEPVESEEPTGVEDPAQVTGEVKPISLFANLRKPVN